MNPEDLQKLRKQYGVPEQGFASDVKPDTSSKVAELDAAWAPPKTADQLRTEKAKRDVGKAADFLGVKKFAEGIGQTASNIAGTQRKADEQLNQSIDMQTRLLGQIKAFKEQGKDTAKLESALTDVTDHIKELGGQVEDIGTGGLSNREIVGSALNTAALFAPGAGELKGMGTAAKLGIRSAEGAATGYAMDVGSKLQDENKTTGEAFTPGAGTIIGAALPGAGTVIDKVALTPAKRIIRSLASGLSGVPAKMIDQFVDNPQAAKEASKLLAQKGNDAVLEKNARTFLDGVSQIKNEARQAYGESIGALKAEDIKPSVFRKGVQGIFDEYGFSTSKQGREIANVEFKDVKNLKKANSIANMLTNTELNGLSLNKTLKRIEDLRYPNAKTEEGLAFNAFVNDVTSRVKQVLNESTDKLSTINSKYAKDMQIAEGIESIMGKVKYKNPTELNKISQQLEGLFKKKGLSPKMIDEFLNRVGENPNKLRTSEAVRQIESVDEGSNSVGSSFGEVARNVTSGLVTPKLVKEIAIKTGLAKEVVAKVLAEGSVAARNLILNAVSGPKD